MRITSASNVWNFWEESIDDILEFDPADGMYSHLYPAVSRTLRSTGFQWITQQFAYDPIDMAYANTEYQTHFESFIRRARLSA